jgi:imidazolonepropionase-like amidohydrolase
VTAVILSLIVLTSSASPATAETLALTHATVLTVSDGTIEDGTVIIKDGRIDRVGHDLRILRGAREIDLTGRYLMPGIIDAHSHLGVYSWPSVPAHWDGNEMTAPATPQVRAMDAINIADPGFALAAAGGVTMALVLPGSGNVIGGETVVVHVIPGATVDEIMVPYAPRGLKMAIGENPKGVYGSRGEMPSTRMGTTFIMRNAFVQALNYRAKWEHYEREIDRGEDPDPPERDLGMETLLDALDGEMLVHIHCYRADGILNLLKIAEEFGFQIRSLEHALEGYKVARQVAAAGVGIATFSDWWGYKMEAWDAIPHGAAIMFRAGIKVAIKSDSANYGQRLYHEAAKTMKYGGLTYEEALTTITINPAWILGVEDEVGTIEEGKRADLAVFDGDPLSVYSRAVMTIIDGRVVYEREE